MSKKNILIICARVPFPIVDGGAHAIYTLIKALHRHGHRLHIISYDSSKHLQDAKGIQDFGNVITRKKINADYGVVDLLKSIISQKPASIFARFDDVIFDSMLNDLNTEDLDTVFYAGLQTCAHLELLKKKYPRAQHILYQVNIEHLLYKRISHAQNKPIYKWAYGKQAEYMKIFEYKSLSMVDKVLFISSKDEAFFKDKLNKLKSISLLPPSLKDPVKIRTLDKSSTLCAFSNWDWAPNYQGLDWFLNHVWPILLTKEPKIQLQIAGRHMSQEQQTRIKETIGVKYIGFVDDLRAFMEGSSVMIAPLISGSGIKIKIIESFAHALPFVTTSIGFEGFEDAFLKSSSVADDPNEFAIKLLELKNNLKLNYQIRDYMFDFSTSNLRLEAYSTHLNEFVYK